MNAPHPGRRWLLFAALLAALAIGVWMMQLFVLRSTALPWYVPVLGAGAVILAAAAFWRKPSLVRGLMALLVVAVGGFEVVFFAYGSLLPKYEGPAKSGAQFPAFSAVRADGTPFTDAELRGHPTVLTFFRGRW